MKSIRFLMPYFGRWPEWFDLFLASCGRNPSIHWLFITDCGVPREHPQNVSFVPMTWRDCAERVREVCGVAHIPPRPYKLCDFKMTWGHVFREHVADYDYWGFGDIDLIYGDLRSFLTAAVLDHDLVTFNRTHIAGHLTLLRNTEEIAAKYRSSPIWCRGADHPEYQFLDENIGFYGIDDVYAIESFNTPLSPYIPWTSGDFWFPRYWYHRDGRLYNSLDGDRHFMYLHFMRYKYRWSADGRSAVARMSQTDNHERWTLSLDGFRPTLPGDETRERGAGIRVRPAVTEALLAG